MVMEANRRGFSDCVGVELNPVLVFCMMVYSNHISKIKSSREWAALEQQTKNVSFLQCDFFDNSQDLLSRFDVAVSYMYLPTLKKLEKELFKRFSNGSPFLFVSILYPIDIIGMEPSLVIEEYKIYFYKN